MTEPVPPPFGTDLSQEVVAAQPEPARPEPARPEAARPEPVRPEPARPEQTVVEEVEAVVLAVPGVARLDGGRFGGLGTYLPGRRVTGVRIDENGTEVHIVVSGIEPVPVTAGRVQRAVSAVAPMPVHVHVEDIDLSRT